MQGPTVSAESSACPGWCGESALHRASSHLIAAPAPPPGGSRHRPRAKSRAAALPTRGHGRGALGARAAGPSTELTLQTPGRRARADSEGLRSSSWGQRRGGRATFPRTLRAASPLPTRRPGARGSAHRGAPAGGSRLHIPPPLGASRRPHSRPPSAAAGKSEACTQARHNREQNPTLGGGSKCAARNAWVQSHRPRVGER